MKINCCSDQHNQIKIGLYRSKLVTNADFFPVIVYDSRIEMDLGYMYQYSYGPIFIKSTLSGKIPEIDYTSKKMPEEGLPPSEGFVDFPEMPGVLLSTFDYTGSWYVPEISIWTAISCNFNNCVPDGFRAKNCNTTIVGQFDKYVEWHTAGHITLYYRFSEAYDVNLNVNITCTRLNIYHTIESPPEANNDKGSGFNIVVNCADAHIEYRPNSCGFMLKPANITVNVKRGSVGATQSVYINGGWMGALQNAAITVNRPILGLTEVANYTETIIRASGGNAWIGSKFTSWYSSYNDANVLQWVQTTVDADGKKEISIYRDHTGNTRETTTTFDVPYVSPCKENNQ